MPEKSNANADKSEIADIAKLFHDDFMYRHTNYWNLVYKSIAAILGLMALPYFLYNTLSDSALLALFPGLGFLVSVFSMILLESEAIRMNLARKRMNNLLKRQSPHYGDIPIDQELPKNGKKKITLYGILLKGRITKKVLFLYIGLILISGMEMYLIFSGRIFAASVTP